MGGAAGFFENSHQLSCNKAVLGLLILWLCNSAESLEPISTRLVGGTIPSEGRVEVFYKGSWGTICDHGWGLDDANVVCRSLGYTEASAAHKGAHFGQGTGYIILDEVGCAGTEPNIGFCQHNGYGRHDCKHNQDAGVTCCGIEWYAASPLASQVAQRGTAFVFAPMPNGYHFSPAIGVILQAITDQPTTIEISVPGILINRIILSHNSGPYEYSLPRYLIPQTTSGVVNSTVYISSDKIISVLHYNLAKYSSDIFTLAPAHYLGLEYFVATITLERYPTHGSGIVSISTLGQSASIEIHLTSTVQFQDKTFYSGDVISYILLPLQSIQLLPQYTNITGTRIISNTSVSVRAGAQCVTVPENVAACDHLAEQLAPLNAWGRIYLLSPFVGRSSGYVFQVVVGRDQTRITYNNSIEMQIIVRNMGEFVIIDVPSQIITFISADKPIMVMQYSKGSASDGKDSDPSMIRVTPIEQFVNEAIFPVYEFASASTNIDTIHLELTAECRYFKNISIFKNDQKLVVTWYENYTAFIHDGIKMCAQWTNITGGSYTLISESVINTGGQVIYPRFRAMVYGTGFLESYLYRAGGSAPLTNSDGLFIKESKQEYDCQIFIRLRGRNSSREGRVEVLYEGEWGTVCDNGFDLNDAHVVCRMLGYDLAEAFWSSAAFGEGTGRIYMDNLQCTGDEATIGRCMQSPFGTNDCGHKQDAGVTCIKRPDRVAKLYFSTSSSRRIEVNWTAALSIGPPDYYIIRYSLFKRLACPAPEFILIEVEDISNSTGHILNGLEPYAMYSISVIAANNAGLSEAVTGYANTSQETPSNITDIHADLGKTSSMSIAFTWQPLTCLEVNGDFWYYFARIYEKERRYLGPASATYLDDDISYSSVEFEGLEPCTMYEFSIHAANRLAPPGHIFISDGETVGQLTQASAVDDTETSPALLVSWSVPSKCNVDYYRILYRLISRKACPDVPVVDAPIYEVSITSTSTNVSQRIPDLEHFATYNISIIAGIRGRETSPEIVFGDTSDGAPPVIQSVSHRSRADMLYFTWEEPACEELHGLLKGYDYDLYNIADQATELAFFIHHVYGNSVQVNGLDADTEYRFRVRVITSNRKSEWHVMTASTDTSEGSGTD